MIVLIAAILGIGALAFTNWPTANPVPTPPVAPAPPRGPETAGGIGGPMAANEHDAIDEAAPPVRSPAVAAPGPDERLAFVEVVVETAPGGAAATSASRNRLPFVEVSLQTAAAVQLARTNDQGLAAFEVANAAGQRAVVRCGLGAEAELVLRTEAPARVVLTVQPRVVVTGKVVDGTGAGVAGATLVLLGLPRPDDECPAPWRVGRSAGDGSFAIGLAVPGRLGAHHRLHGPSAMFAVQTGRAGEAPPIVTLELVLLSRPAQVSGVVLDHAGRPVAFAELEFRSTDAPPPGAELRASPVRVRSDAYGAYVATRLAPGTIEYGARACGHGPRTDRLRLEPGQAAALDVRLTAACTLSGTASDRDGTPVRARIVAGTPDAFASARATADADGRFVLADLAPGGTPVLAQGARGARAAATLELQPGDQNHWHAVLTAAGDDANLRGALVDQAGQPLRGHRVQVRPGRGPAPGTTTADDGSFALRVAEGARVDLRVYAPGRPVTGFADGVFRDLDPAAGRHQLQLQPGPRGNVTGRVETAGHAGVPASVTVWHHERAERVRLSAGVDGTIAFVAVPAGTLDLLVEHPAHAGATRRDLSLPPFGRLDLGVIVLGAGGALSGAVRGPGGTTPEYCQLTVLTADQQRFHADYSGGAYRFPTLPTGNHTLLVQAPDLAAISFAIAIGANTEKVQDVELRAGVARRFRVVLPREAPGHCALVLRPPGQTMQWLATGGGRRSDDQAALAIEFVACMVPGAYEAVAWAAGGWEARLPVVFTAADDSEVVLTLSRQ